MSTLHISNNTDYGKKIFNFVFFLIVSLFLIEYISCYINAQVRIFPDSNGYISVAKESIFNLDFWLSSRPVGYPILIKLFGDKIRLIAAFQMILAAASWILFSIYIYLNSKKRILGLIGGSLVLLIAIMPDISSWNFSILTESITFSLLPLLFVAFLSFINTKKSRYFYISLVILIIFSMIRDVNSYYTLSFIAVIIITYYCRHIKIVTLTLSIILLTAAFLFSNYSSDHGERWVFSYHNLVGTRFLNSHSILRHMKDHGMPITEALTKRRDHYASTKSDAGIRFIEDPDLKEFRAFVKNNGKSTYMKYLLTQPIYTFGEIWKHKEGIFHIHKYVWTGYYPEGFRSDNSFKYTAIKNLYFYIFFAVIITLVSTISLALKRNLYNKNSLPIISFLIPIFPLVIVTLHGDSMEVGRHTLILPILLKITLFTICYILWNELIDSQSDANQEVD